MVFVQPETFECGPPSNDFGARTRIPTLWLYAESFVEPFGTLWFIYLLPIFFVVTKLAHGRIPAWLIWLAAAALEIAPIATGWTVIDEFAGRFVYFYTGYLLAPRLFTFQDFAEEIVRANDPAARPLSDVQRRLLAEDIVADLHREKALSHFERVADTRGFTLGVFDLLAELKRAEVWPEHLTDHVVSRKGQQCALLYARYQQQVQRLRLYDQEGRVWYASDLLSRGRRRPFEDVRAVFVDGFTDFTRTQMEILLNLCE